ncbi:MAG: RNA methyltransferase, partial [Acidobacteriales bacterium]|nr:RNA methyltransferase [Terriglobales bacterium]
VELEAGRLVTSARRVRSGHLFSTQAFRDGRVHIQDEASQLVGLLVGYGRKILDCCAAPGGKAAILAERNPGAFLVAADLHPHRARLLRSLVHTNGVHVIAADARALPVPAIFDRVLVDVPCSGTGTLARNPDIKWRLKIGDPLRLRDLQLAILKSAMMAVAVGGRLVYSTCSLEPAENRQVVESALAEAPAFKLINCRTELERLRSEGQLVCADLDGLLQGPYLRTIPGVHPCDGFFAAILERVSV